MKVQARSEARAFSFMLSQRFDLLFAPQFLSEILIYRVQISFYPPARNPSILSQPDR